jgi:hypothetical protein
VYVEKNILKSKNLGKMEEKEKYSYNRIIIIGNGFDKALNLPTSYSEFVLEYLKKSCIKSLSCEFKSKLLTLKFPEEYSTEGIEQMILRTSNKDELIDLCRSLNLRFIKKSELLTKILEKQSIGNWVDIEAIYFNLLLLKLDIIKKHPALGRNYQDIITLNEEFEELTRELENYIKHVDNSFRYSPQDPLMYDLMDEFLTKDHRSDMSIKHQGEETSDPSNLLFVNFNYTSTLNKVLNSFAKQPVDILHIHGNVNDPANGIIFGYGDDIHSRYKELEEENNDEILKYIKSFYYTYTNNYQRLIDFILDEKYEVCIVGHSCGLSDRTLLKTIFEDPNCISIKIYTYQGANEHFYKTIAVSRHCENKALMRHKIIPFDIHAVIPQRKN